MINSRTQRIFYAIMVLPMMVGGTIVMIGFAIFGLHIAIHTNLAGGIVWALGGGCMAAYFGWMILRVVRFVRFGDPQVCIC